MICVAVGALLGTRFAAERTTGPESLASSAAISPETHALWDKPLGHVRVLRATADNLTHIAAPESVRELFLDAPQLAAPEYALLARFANLEHLRIRGAALTDEAAFHIARRSTLRVLNVPQANFTDAGATALARLPQLELLRLSSPRLTAAAIEAFALMPKLRFLHLIDIPLTDEALVPLEGQRQLESLYIDGAQLTDDGIGRLLRALPDVHLHIDQQHHDRDPRRHVHDAAPNPAEQDTLDS